MKIANIIKWSAIIGGSVYLINKAGKIITTAKQLTSSVTGVKFSSFSFPVLNFVIEVTVTNPTNNDAVATSFTGTLSSPATRDAQANQLATFNVAFNNAQGIVIAANSSTRININAQANLLSVASSILSTGYNAVLDATIVVSGIALPLHNNITISNGNVQIN